MHKHFRELTVWQKAMDLVTEVYRVSESFPRAEQFGLVSQLRRAAVSVPSNIAEGQGRASVGEFQQFLGHARGSLCEVGTQIEIAGRLGLADGKSITRVLEMVDDVARMLNALIRSLKESSN